jgi:3-isopropylmalate dehydratase small subunit
VTPFTVLTSTAVPLSEANVDTDIILPARFLLITEKAGLGRYAFYERRFDAADQPKPGFALNDPSYAGAQIMVAGENFGCGSSREQAVWALADLGLRCIIAPSFGEIFAANCLRNGMLALALPEAEVAALIDDARSGRAITVDLERCSVVGGDGRATPFVIAEADRTALLNGWDEIARIAALHGPAIAAFEAKQQQTQPWLWSARHA